MSILFGNVLDFKLWHRNLVEPFQAHEVFQTLLRRKLLHCVQHLETCPHEMSGVVGGKMGNSLGICILGCVIRHDSPQLCLSSVKFEMSVCSMLETDKRSLKKI
jgi:hypothetical protein